MEFLCLEYFFISILQSGGNDSSTVLAVFLKDFMCVCVCVWVRAEDGEGGNERGS